VPPCDIRWMLRTVSPHSPQVAQLLLYEFATPLVDQLTHLRQSNQLNSTYFS
jgi:hypothetical protein